MGNTQKLLTMGAMTGIACSCCGESITQGKRYLACPDCGAIFCEACVQEGTYANHDCQDYDCPDPAEYDN